MDWQTLKAKLSELGFRPSGALSWQMWRGWVCVELVGCGTPLVEVRGTTYGQPLVMPFQWALSFVQALPAGEFEREARAS